MTDHARRVVFLLFLLSAILGTLLLSWYPVLIGPQFHQELLIVPAVVFLVDAIAFGIIWLVAYRMHFPAASKSDRMLACIWATLGFALAFIAVALSVSIPGSHVAFRLALNFSMLAGLIIVSTTVWYYAAVELSRAETARS